MFVCFFSVCFVLILFLSFLEEQWQLTTDLLLLMSKGFWFYPYPRPWRNKCDKHFLTSKAWTNVCDFMMMPQVIPVVLQSKATITANLGHLNAWIYSIQSFFQAAKVFLPWTFKNKLSFLWNKTLLSVWNKWSMNTWWNKNDEISNNLTYLVSEPINVIKVNNAHFEWSKGALINLINVLLLSFILEQKSEWRYRHEQCQKL